MAGLKLITAPATYPVTRAEAKLHCRVDSTDEDTLIDGLIAAATEAAEQETGRALISQTWEATFDGFPGIEVAHGLTLTKVPLASVTSVKYIDVDGNTQTVNSSNYVVASDDFGYCTVAPAYGAVWPATRAVPNSVQVRYVAGYTTVPEPIKQWIKLLISTMYDNRETESYSSRAVSTTVKMQFVDRLLDRYRVIPV